MFFKGDMQNDHRSAWCRNAGNLYGPAASPEGKCTVRPKGFGRTELGEERARSLRPIAF